jgi:hypothetical protein
MTFIAVNGDAFQETDGSNMLKGESSQKPYQHLNHNQESQR